MFNIESILGKTELNHCIAIYVPSTINITEKIDNSAYVDETAQIMSGYFGGATAISTNGYYIADVGLVKESTTKVYSFCTESDLEIMLSDVVKYCAQMRDNMVQECIGLEVDNKMYFI